MFYKGTNLAYRTVTDQRPLPSKRQGEQIIWQSSLMGIAGCYNFDSFGDLRFRN